MEALGAGLNSLGNAISSIAGWTGAICIVGIAAITFLTYTKVITIDDIKNFFDNKGRRYR